jgi:hypothetical protein
MRIRPSCAQLAITELSTFSLLKIRKKTDTHRKSKNAQKKSFETREGKKEKKSCSLPMSVTSWYETRQSGSSNRVLQTSSF